MLAGRESLIRLVGKRRRNLPRHLLFDDPPEQPPPPSLPPSPLLPPIPNKSGCKSSNAQPLWGGGGSEICVDGVGWVECPVCGRSIRGTDYMVNSHLDSCLARGTKRKLTQRTLLQFCTTRSLSKGKIRVDEPQSEHSVTTREKMLDEKSEPSCFSGDCGGQECLSDPVVYSPMNGKTHSVVLVGNKVDSFAAGAEIEGYSLPCFSIPSNNDAKLHINDIKDVLSVTVLDTIVVGHRYHNEHELSQGDGIYVLRDPENVKDQNALKVLCSDSDNGTMVGYLPKELAKYLSPLINRYHLKFEGSVTSSTEHHLDAVPVQLFCQGMVPYDEMEPDDIQHLKYLWGNVLRVVEYGKTFAPNMIKYQQNFHVMIQEVLNRHKHLFMENEKSFLESFSSLSDDSQRVFIRLYTRKDCGEKLGLTLIPTPWKSNLSSKQTIFIIYLCYAGFSPNMNGTKGVEVRGPWFRTSNISYLEVQDAKKAIKELQLAGYVCPFSFTGESCKSDIPEVLNLLTVFELREISNVALLKKQKGVSCSNKLELINGLSAAYEEETCPLLPNLIMERTGTCIKISSVAELLLWRIQRLFFLSGEQDLSAFLLVDLGVINYPSYTCNVSQPIFQDRNDLLAYEEAIAVAQIMDESIEENNMEMVMRCIGFSDGRIPSVPESSSTFLSCFSSSWVYSKVVTLGISFCEREQRYEDAVKLLKGLLKRIKCGGKRGYWTFRLSVDLDHMGYTNESLSVAEEGMVDPWVRAGSKLALQRRVLRLGKPPRRWKKPSFAESISRKIKEVHVRGRPLNCEIGTKNRYYGHDGGQCGVEQLALQYYAREGGGWMGVHAESGIWMTIFGLLMWDIIFWDISDVFQTRFQTAPLDLGTDSFYISRKDVIESHLRKIHDGMAEEILISSWELHTGTACKGVNWDHHCLVDLRAIVSCIGGHCLASLCRHLAQDYRSWSSGMPDLLLWRFYGGDGDGGEAKLVEVKGPRDRLSEQQRAWMLILMDCGFNTEVCRVSATPQSTSTDS